MMIQSIPLSWAKRHCANAIAEGVSLEYLFDHALISPRFDDDRDRISSAQLALLYYQANLSTEDEARRNSRKPIPMGFGGLAARTLFGCPTLESALGAVIRLAKLTGVTLQFALRVDHDEARLVVHSEDGRRDADSASLEDAYLSFMFMCINQFLGRTLPLLALETRDPGHMNMGAAHWATGAPVRAAPVSALLFPKRVLQSPQVRGVRDELFGHIFRDWISFVEAGAQRLPLSDAPLGAVRVRHLASIEGVSAATLRRRLDPNGGFRQARAKAVVSEGLERLLGSRDSVDAIALQLGYADARSFRRFLKEATGKTPAEWRNDGDPSRYSPVNPAVHQRIAVFAHQMDVAL